MTEPISERDALIEQAASLIPQATWDLIFDAGLSVEDAVGPIVDGLWRPTKYRERPDP
jgi:hypothetical protein